MTYLLIALTACVGGIALTALTNTAKLKKEIIELKKEIEKLKR